MAAPKATMTAEAGPRSRLGDPGLWSAWPLLLGFAALAIPTALHLATQQWTLESGAHGPIVIGIGGWLIVRRWRELAPFSAGAWPIALSLLAIALPTYVFGSAYGFSTLEAGGLYVAGVALLYSNIGLAGLRRLWFPLLFIAFAVPPPHAWMDAATAPLKQLVSFAATSVLGAAGLPVSRQGVTIVVAQYQLLVADACSGLGSLWGLIAIGLLYVYMMRGS